MWLPDPVAAVEFAAALLSAVAAVLSIAQRVSSRGRRREDEDGDGDDAS